MYRLFAWWATSAALCVGLSSAGGGEPAPKEREPKTYTVSCTLTRKLLVDGGDDKKVETFTSNMPDVTTLEGTRGVYKSGGKLNGVPFGFQLRVEVRPGSGDKVRFAVTADDSGAEGGGLSTVVRGHRQEVVRLVRLGQVIKLELDRNDSGEGTWVELTVREAVECGVPAPKGSDAMGFEFHPKPCPRTDLQIELAAAKAAFKDKRGIILPLKITNASGEVIKTSLAHEWHGGEWPSTSLYVSVSSKSGKNQQPFVPVYLAGEDPDLPPAVSLSAGKSVGVELRMDWSGTGSVIGAPLINKPGKYVARFALVFEAGGKPQYVVSAPIEVEYKPE